MQMWFPSPYNTRCSQVILPATRVLHPSCFQGALPVTVTALHPRERKLKSPSFHGYLANSLLSSLP